MAEPFTSGAIPDWTRAGENARTPAGLPAVFRSSSHAWMALRLVYLADVAHIPPHEVALKTQYYRWAWERYIGTAPTCIDSQP